MKENLLEQVPEFKLHKTGTILITTFLAGPLVAGFLIAENFNQLKERPKVMYTWIVTLIVFALLILSAFIPALENVPNVIFPFLYTGVAAFFVNRYQDNQIKLHAQNGGEFFSVGRAILASIISLVLLIGAFLFVLFLVDPAPFAE